MLQPNSVNEVYHNYVQLKTVITMHVFLRKNVNHLREREKEANIMFSREKKGRSSEKNYEKLSQ